MGRKSKGDSSSDAEEVIEVEVPTNKEGYYNYFE
jgi:hypothetical protein